MNISITEDYEKQCGEVFLTVNGNIIIHCTLCEKKYYGYSEYVQHIQEKHFSKTVINEYVLENESDISNVSPEFSEATETFVSLVSKEDLKMFDLEFIAPKPNNCKEIEEYVISMQDGEPNIELKSIQNSFHNNVNKGQTTSSSNSKYKCPECGYISKSSSNLSSHMKHHTGIKRYQCPICLKRFYVHSEFKVHMRFHSKERPYFCDDCGHICYTLSDLTIHTKSCKNIQDAECNVCGKKFHQKSSLQNHMTTHSNNSEFYCNTCGTGFKFAKDLKNHMKIHNNKQDYECRLCPAKFNQQSGLFSHLKSNHSRANFISVSLKKS